MKNGTALSSLIQTLDKGAIAHMPTAEQQQQKNKPVEPRFKIDHAASPMPKTRQPERLAPRATSNRNGGGPVVAGDWSDCEPTMTIVPP
jgi:hypothetical protein